MAEERMLNDEILLGLIKANSGGGGGTDDYNDLKNQPKIEGVTLTGNKTASDLGLASEDDLADKQDALTAGNYISIANDGTINVTQGIGVYDVYSYEIKSINSGYATKITKRKNGVFVSEQDISNGTYSSENRLNVDDRFEFWYTFAGYLWHYKLLVDSNEHQKDEEVSWEYSTLVDYTETFNVSQDSSTDLATKGDIDAAISSAYHHAGTKTCAELVAGLLVAGNEGNVYNMTDSGTTTSDFIEGAGQPIKAGDNVGIAKISDGVYKFDLLSGFVDTTNFVQKSVTVGLLKNDGTVNDEIEGDVSSLKSGLTNLDNEVNGDAVTYPYADVITIPDAIPANLADCSVKIEPVQNLHGYDKPWVGGAGKNKLPLVLADIKAANASGTWSGNAYTLNGVTFTVNTDNDGNVISINANGTATAIVYFDLIPSFNSTEFVGMIYNGNPSNSNATIRVSGSDRVAKQTFYNGSVVENKGDNLKVAIRVEYATINNEIFYPMLRLATETDATFAPYTNICPITGHTEASVQRVGKNLCSELESGTLNEYGMNTARNGRVRTKYYIRVVEGQQYVVSALPSVSGKVVNIAFNGFAKDDYATHRIYDSGWLTSGSYITIPSGVKFVRCVFRYETDENITPSSFEDVQLELGSTATPYEPYAGKTYTIALGDTIYGGTLDFDSGVMTVTHAVVEYDGSIDEGWVYEYFQQHYHDFRINIADSKGTISKSELFLNEAQVGYGNGTAWISSTKNLNVCIGNAIGVDTVESFMEWLSNNPLQVVYPLATPTTIQLTPTQIQLLKGQNTITASTGQISVTVNGVSGAIGSVQEQVNELAEDVADVQSGLDTVQSGLTTLGTRVNGIYTRTFYNDTTSTTLNNVYLPKTDKHTIAIIAGNDICTMVVSSSSIVEQNNIRNQITVALNENNQFVVSGCPYYSRPMFIATYDFRQQPT